MRFFKGKLKPAPAPARAKPEEESHSDMPELISGMRVEVLTTENHLLFAAKLGLPGGGGVLELRRESGDPLPQALSGSKVRIRGFLEKGSAAFLLGGTVTESSMDHWRVEQLEVLQMQDGRTFYRQRTNMDALAMPSGRYRTKEDQSTCRILDISASGVRFFSKDAYQLKERLILEVTPIAEEEPFSITCEILRVLELEGGKYEYGCQFVDLDEREQQRLLKVIFVLQRRMLQARRG